MDNNNFIQKLRDVINSYSGGERSEELTRKKEAQRDTRSRASMQQLIGAALMGGGSQAALGTATVGGPAAAFGVPVGLGASALGTYLIRDADDKMHAIDSDIDDKIQQANTQDWTEYKNDAINSAAGNKYAVDDMARAGKMIDDNGNVVDIDYDYYSTVPYSTLERVFGVNGAGWVKDAIDSRKAR